METLKPPSTQTTDFDQLDWVKQLRSGLAESDRKMSTAALSFRNVTVLTGSFWFSA